MCGRFTLTTDWDAAALAASFGAETVIADAPADAGWIAPRYNIAPTQPAAAVLIDGGRRVLDALRWGLLPAWAQDRSIAGRLINARAETLERRPVFRDAFARRRCLIPSDGFYEWSARGRAPHWIRFRDRRPFAYAGLYERRAERCGGELRTFTIITTEPNGVVRPLHDRMPVIIPPDGYDRWLDPSLGGAGRTERSAVLRALLRPYPAAEMIAQPVARTVNRADAEGPACVLPAPAAYSLDVNLDLFAEATHGNT